MFDLIRICIIFGVRVTHTTSMSNTRSGTMAGDMVPKIPFKKKKGESINSLITRPYRLLPRWSMVKHPYPFITLTLTLTPFYPSTCLSLLFCISRYPYLNELESSQSGIPEPPGHHVSHLGKRKIEGGETRDWRP